jgi:hypothetical protein
MYYLQENLSRRSVAHMGNELFLAPECRAAAEDDRQRSARDGRKHVGLQAPHSPQEHMSTDIWTIGVVFWQMLTLLRGNGFIQKVWLHLLRA